jgi:hypothetical protein
MRRKDAGLSFKTKNRPVNIGFAQQHAGVIRQVSRRKIIRAIHHDVVLRNNLHRVFARDPLVVNHHLRARIDAGDRLLGRIRLGPAHIRRRMNDLPLKIRKIHRIKIQQPNFPDARRGQIHRDRRTQTARPDAQHTRRADFFLPGHPHLGKNQMPRIPPDFVIAQFHNQSFKYPPTLIQHQTFHKVSVCRSSPRHFRRADPGVDQAWEEEIEQRIVAIKSGKAKGRPFPDVLREIDQQLRR